MSKRAGQLAREGVLPVVRLGRQYRVDPERLSEWIGAGGRPLPGGWRRAAPCFMATAARDDG